MMTPENKIIHGSKLHYAHQKDNVGQIFDIYQNIKKGNSQFKSW